MKNRMQTGMKNRLGTLVAGAALLLAAACTLSDPDKGDKDDKGPDGEGGFSVQQEMTLLAHTPPRNGQPGMLVTREIETWCEEGAPVRDTVADTSLYVIQGGELFVWGDGDCTVGERLSGTSSTIMGTWTGTYAEGTGGPVPAPYRPAECDDLGEEDDFDFSFIEDSKTKIVVSEDKISMSMSGTLCYARAMATLFSALSPEVDTVSLGCSEAVLRNADNETATLTSSYTGGEVSLTFQYGATTCLLVESLDLLPSEDEDVCAEGNGEGAGDEGMECMGASGFFGDMEMLEKASATRDAKGLLRSLR